MFSELKNRSKLRMPGFTHVSAVGLRSSEVQETLYKSLPQLNEQCTVYISKTSADEGTIFTHTRNAERFFLLPSHLLKEHLLNSKGERPSNSREKQPSEAALLFSCLYFHSDL